MQPSERLCPHVGSVPHNAPPISRESSAPTSRSLRWRLSTRRMGFLSLLPDDVFAHEFSEIRVLWQRYLIVNDPDAARHVLVDHADRYARIPTLRRSFQRVLGDSLITTEGETWRRHRHIMAPALTPKGIRHHAPLVSEAIAALIGRWAKLPDGTVVDIVAPMRQAMIALIGQAMFSTESQDEVATVQASVPHYVRGMRPGVLDLLANAVASLPAGRPRRMLSQFDLLVKRLVARRSAGTRTADDLLDLLLAAQKNGDMSLREVTDHVAHMFFVGHDAPEQTLVWAWYLLSQYPTEEEKLHAEVDCVLAGRVPTVEDLPALGYTQMVIKETMRLYPAVHTLARQALVDDEVIGRRVPKGSSVLVVPWLLHRHPRIWDRADTFNPERFSPERARGRHPFAYIPFGAGPRICLGANFAMLETTLFLAGLAQHYRLRLALGQRVEPMASVTLRPRHGMAMNIERRTSVDC